MLLAIDVGNTNVKFGVFRGEELLGQWRLITDHNITVDEYRVHLRNLFERSGQDPKSIHGIAMASVVPPLDHVLRQIAEIDFELTPLVVDYTTDTGLKILYDPPSALGPDRIVGAVAAVAKYGAPCIVVDFGTATTFNVVNAAQEYLGGVIAPGIMIAAEALFSRTAKLPRIEIKRPEKVIGSSTVGAMQSGLYYGYVGLVGCVLEKIVAELGMKPPVIATGGHARVIAMESNFIDHVDSTLTLDGLRLVYERNFPNHN
jgi:type III pantothenate kinase